MSPVERAGAALHALDWQDYFARLAALDMEDERDRTAIADARRQLDELRRQADAPLDGDRVAAELRAGATVAAPYKAAIDATRAGLSVGIGALERAIAERHNERVELRETAGRRAAAELRPAVDAIEERARRAASALASAYADAEALRQAFPAAAGTLTTRLRGPALELTRPSVALLPPGRVEVSSGDRQRARRTGRAQGRGQPRCA